MSKVLFLPVLLMALCCSAPAGNENTTILINTTMGDIKLKLYDNTPLHRDNFIKLIKSDFYKGISFHRIINEFMIQAGDPKTLPGFAASPSDTTSNYTIPAEFNKENFHKKGALAAARMGNDVNPEMRSSGTQFYIVQGIKYNEDELNSIEKRINSNIKQALFNNIMKETADSIAKTGTTVSEGLIQEISSIKMFEYLTVNPDYNISEEQRSIYKSLGGVPRLDGAYTVFGEVTEGLDIVDLLAAVPTDNNDRPITDVKIIKIKIVKK